MRGYSSIFSHAIKPESAACVGLHCTGICNSLTCQAKPIVGGCRDSWQQPDSELSAYEIPQHLNTVLQVIQEKCAKSGLLNSVIWDKGGDTALSLQQKKDKKNRQPLIIIRKSPVGWGNL